MTSIVRITLPHRQTEVNSTLPNTTRVDDACRRALQEARIINLHDCAAELSGHWEGEDLTGTQQETLAQYEDVHGGLIVNVEQEPGNDHKDPVARMVKNVIAMIEAAHNEAAAERAEATAERAKMHSEAMVLNLKTKRNSDWGTKLKTNLLDAQHNQPKELSNLQGIYSVVYQAREAATACQTAIQKFKNVPGHNQRSRVLDIFRVSSQKNLSFVLEFLDSDIELIIKDRARVFLPADIKAWMAMTFCELECWYCHFILHRDLDLDNLLINGQLEVADFGLACDFANPV